MADVSDSSNTQILDSQPQPPSSPPSGKLFFFFSLSLLISQLFAFDQMIENGKLYTTHVLKSRFFYNYFYYLVLDVDK